MAAGERGVSGLVLSFLSDVSVLSRSFADAVSRLDAKEKQLNNIAAKRDSDFKNLTGAVKTLRQGDSRVPPGSALGRGMIFFMHIPSTGGTTLTSIVRKSYSEEQVLFIPRNDLLLGIRKLKGSSSSVSPRIVVAPYPFSIVRMMPRVNCFTVVRSPLQRVLSYLDFLRRSPSNTNKKWNKLHNWISERGRASYILHAKDVEIDNWQTRMLSGVGATAPFGGLDDDLLNMAKRNVEESFFFVGVTEQLDDAVSFLAPRLGWCSEEHPRLNVSSDRDLQDRRSLASTELEFLERHNRLDSALYSWVLERQDVWRSNV